MLTEKIIETAKNIGCEEKVLEAKEISSYLGESKTRNIAVLGETNSGKTTLMNKLCGKEVRPATKLSLGEAPLKVIFDSDEKDDNYEIVKADNEANSGLSFNEIPLNAAIDYDTKQPTLMLEKMDAVIYIMSAVMPMTASDVDNITALKDKFPVMLYISKTDMLEDENEAAEVTEYIRNAAADMFGSSEIPIFSSADDSTESLMQILKSMETEWIREYHIGRIEEAAKQVVTDTLNDKLKALKKERALRERKNSAYENEARDEKLKWAKLRVDMLEYGQKTINMVDKKLEKEEDAAKQDIRRLYGEAKNKKGWLKSVLKVQLSRKIEEAETAAFEEARRMTASHRDWFIDRVNKDYNMNITVEELECRYSLSNVNVSKYNKSPKTDNVFLALGSGVAAGAAIASSIPLLPTLVIAVPASILTVAFTRNSIDDLKKYNEEVMGFIDKTCAENFSKLTDVINSGINDFYEKIVYSMHSIVLGEAQGVSFEDIDREEAEIKQLLSEIK